MSTAKSSSATPKASNVIVCFLLTTLTAAPLWNGCDEQTTTVVIEEEVHTPQDLMDTSVAEVLDTSPDLEDEDTLQPPTCQPFIDSWQPTEGWIPVEDGYGEEVSVLRAPLTTDGCAVYGAEVVWNPPDCHFDGRFDCGYAESRVHICHTCPSPRRLHWWTHWGGGERGGEFTGNAVKAFVDLAISDVVRQGDAFLLESCLTSPRILDAINIPLIGDPPPPTPDFVEPAAHAWSIPILAGEVLTLPGGYLLAFFDDAEYVEPNEPLLPYWDHPIDYDAPLTFELALPRLWDAELGLEDVIPERQTAIACELAGLPWHESMFNPLTLDPPWSEDERLYATVPNFTFPPWFEEWRATNRAVRP